jgi:hypothetical protein
VTFTPTVSGADNGALTITDDAAASPQTLGLTGIGLGPGVLLSPTSLTFPDQQVGTTSAPLPVTLTNSGTATLNIASIVSAGDFAQTNNCGTSLGAGGSCTITVTFTPTQVGSRTGSISISDNASGTPQLVTLSGNGT